MRATLVLATCVLLMAGCTGERIVDGIAVVVGGRPGGGMSLNQPFALATLDQ
jgi:hypothetical protein